jgi:hypothetical protein
MRVSVSVGTSSFSDVEQLGDYGGAEAPPSEPPPLPPCERRVIFRTAYSQLLLRKGSYHTPVVVPYTDPQRARGGKTRRFTEKGGEKRREP